MKKLTQSEQGYTLLLTVAVIVIFTILGLGLITLTSSGIKKNEVRQDTVQARDLADKGIKYAVNDIQLYLEKYIKNNPMGKTQFYDLLSKTLLKSSCPDGIEIPGENTSKTKVCIDNVAMISNEEKDRYKRRVTFKSTGIVNGKTHTTTSKVIIGTDAIPDQLRYALSTNDGGDMYLHGGVEVQGDIKTDGNLIIAEKAFWDYPETPRWVNSVGPRLIKDTKSVTPKIIMKENGKNIYINNGTDFINNKKDDEYAEKYFLNIENFLKNDGKDIKNKFTVLPPFKKDILTTLKSNLFNTSNLDIVTKSELPKDTVEVKSKIDENFKSAKEHDGLYITKQSDLNLLSNKNDTIFVGKKSQSQRSYQNRNMTINTSHKNLSLRGTYYVSGDLNISNTNLYSDALIYVNGDVKIKYSTLQGIDNNSTLIIFANGNIDISNISENSDYDKPSTIKGFFYTKSNMIMYGVGSNIRLTGGISSKRLILTAIRGDFKNNSPISNQKQLDSKGQPTFPSRLKIIYDENLITQYTSFTRDQKEEYITQLNDPEYIERSN